MNNVSMANMNAMAGGPVGPAIPMMNNGTVPPPAVPRPQQQIDNKHLLNTYIYEYFLRNEMYDCARAILNSDPQIKVQDGPNTRRDENGNLLGNGVGDGGMDVDSKDGIDAKRPEDLPQPSIANPSMDNPFLYEWFCLFWDMFNAQKGRSSNGQVNSYMNHTQNQSRLRQNQQQELLRQMRPDMTSQQQQLQMMQMRNGMNMGMQKGNNLPRTAMANSQNNPQMMHMLQQQQKQGQMQRDPSDMDGNRARQSSPGSAENAPSPSKRPRLEGGPFNPAQGGMMPNGRPAVQGMPGQQQQQQVGTGPSHHAEQLLLQSGINPQSLNPEQFATFQNQSPAVQQKTIQTYAANLQQQQSQQMGKPLPNANGPPGQGSPMVPQAPDGATINSFYNAEGMGGPGMRGPGGPNANQQAGGSNHALQDYQMQLMLLEQQNKKRLMMARQEHDGGNSIQMPREGPGGPGAPGGPAAPPGANAPFQGTSPQGARPGASPNPTDMKRGPQQMNPAGMGSPLPEGAQSRGSPNTMNFMGNQMDPNQAPHFMGGGGNIATGPQMNGMRPPSSHPGQPPFNGPMNPQQQQQMMAARQQGQMGGQPGQQPMQWQQQQGGPGGPNGTQMVPQGGQTPQQVQGTPQQRNAAMPPPAQPAAAAVAANARNTSSPQVSNAAPPTPSQTNKAAPKKKETKSAKEKRAAAQKKSNANLNAAGATPVAEPPAEVEAPTPATPITPVNPQQNVSRPGQSAGPTQAMPNGQAPAPVPPQAAPPMVAAPPDQNQTQGFNMDGMEFSMDFANPLATNDVLNDFDFDSFLHDNEGDAGGFDFSAAANFMDPEIET